MTGFGFAGPREGFTGAGAVAIRTAFVEKVRLSVAVNALATLFVLHQEAGFKPSCERLAEEMRVECRPRFSECQRAQKWLEDSISRAQNLLE